MAVQGWFEPQTETGYGGWYSETPEWWTVDDSASAGGDNLYYCIGDSSNRTKYLGVQTTTVYPEATVTLTAAELASYVELVDGVLYYDTATGVAANMAYSEDVKFTLQGPVAGDIEVLDLNKAVVTTGNILASYTFRIKDIYPTAVDYTPTVDQTEFKLLETHVLVDNMLVDRITYQYEDQYSVSYDYPVTCAVERFWPRVLQGDPKVQDTTLIPYQTYYIGLPGFCGHESITSRYVLADHMSKTGSAFPYGTTLELMAPNGMIKSGITTPINSVSAIHYNDAGATHAHRFYCNLNSSVIPQIDRIAVTQVGDNDCTIMGNFVDGTVATSVEYCEESRVPMIHSPFIATAPEMAYSYSENRTNVASGPKAGIGTSILLADAYIDYSNMLFNVNEGTLNIWIKPQFLTEPSGTEFALFDYARVYDPYNEAGVPEDQNRFMGYMELNGGETHWDLVFEVRDPFGNIYQAKSLSVVPKASSDSTWHHLSFRWRLNQPGEGFMKVYVDNVLGATVVEDSDVQFSVEPRDDYTSQNDQGIADTSLYYSPFRLASYIDDAASQNAAPIYLADFVLYDVVNDSDHSAYTSYAGWKETGTEVDTASKQFKLSMSLSTSGEAKIIKLRGVDGDGTKLSDSHFRSPSVKPVLIRAPWTGVALPDADVVRFRLYDATGRFPDYQFPVNPSVYTQIQDELVSSSRSVSGSRMVATSKPSGMSMALGWNRIDRKMMMELAERAMSGYSFFLVDHNDRCLYGKMTLKEIDEIISTVPSMYKVSIDFIGQGGAFDFVMSNETRIAPKPYGKPVYGL